MLTQWTMDGAAAATAESGMPSVQAYIAVGLTMLAVAAQQYHQDTALALLQAAA